MKKIFAAIMTMLIVGLMGCASTPSGSVSGTLTITDIPAEYEGKALSFEMFGSTPLLSDGNGQFTYDDGEGTVAIVKDGAANVPVYIYEQPFVFGKWVGYTGSDTVNIRLSIMSTSPSENLTSFEEYVKFENGIGVLKWEGPIVPVVPEVPAIQFITPPDDDFVIIQNSDGKTVTIASYKGSARNIIIPQILYGLPVTVIGKEAFKGKRLTNVVIPEGIIAIESGSITRSVWSGDDIIGAFSDNELTTITIPDSVTSIGNLAFYSNGLTSIILGKNVTTVGQYAFLDNPLTSITIGNDVDIDKNIEQGGSDNNFVSFINFYESQNRSAGTYVKNGPLWQKQ
jgi:hypothetical protein